MKLLKNLVAPLVAAVFLAGCAGAPMDTPSAALPAICIVSGEDAGDGPTAEYMGHTVNFCCDKCMSKWNGMDDTAKKAAWDKLPKPE